MRVINYLAFTVLSIFIQFCVMDFIQGKIQTDGIQKASNQSQKETFHDVLKNISSKPHALYYRTNRVLRKTPSAFSDPLSKIYDNSTLLVALETTTDISTTILDILFDENATETPTTEIYITTTDFGNVTEITFFEKKNKSMPEDNIPPKPKSNKYCGCNLLYKVCDINCCCDPDCADMELRVFECSEIEKTDSQLKYSDGCISYLANNDHREITMIDNLFCVVKTNLPSKRRITKYNEAAILQNYKWHNWVQPRSIYEFKKTIYKKSDPIWLLKNGTIYYLDFPFPMINNYCTDRKPITFLKQEEAKCNVKLKDLEMFHIKSSEEAVVISATATTINDSVVNCSSVHCVNFSILACKNGFCVNYNHSLHEASCTETICSNLSLKTVYEFYYYDSKIVNATIKLHLQNISAVLPYLTQEIHVNFIMANKSMDQVVELSGNPGYINNLPVLVSYAEKNYSDNFFNNTLIKKTRLHFPENKNGLCVLSNTSSNIVKFGINRRTKCRFVYPHVTKMDKHVCKNVQDHINSLLGLNKNISVSPYGNPFNITDDNWISLRDKDRENVVYGIYNEPASKLHCYNLVDQVTVVFTVANVDEKEYTGQNKILASKYEITPKNISFNAEEISIVISVDIIFIDVTKPSLTVYAGSPHVNIHLPKDFFFPFPPNSYGHKSSECILTIYTCVFILITNKITLE